MCPQVFESASSASGENGKTHDGMFVWEGEKTKSLLGQHPEAGYGRHFSCLHQMALAPGKPCPTADGLGSWAAPRDIHSTLGVALCVL
jgi:hypothetical protein